MTIKTLFGQSKVHYNGQIKKYSALFGSLFSDLYIQRVSNKRTELVKVPIRYGPGEIRNHTTDLNNPRAKPVLPAMSFEIHSLTKDIERMTNQYNRIRKGTPEVGNFSEKFSNTPVPYNIKYTLSIRSKTIEDMSMIIEQIIAAFNPQVTINVIDNNELGYERDITIVLDSDTHDFQDNYEHSQEESRTIDVQLDFTVKGYLYKITEIKPVVLELSLDQVKTGFNFTNLVAETEEYVQSATLSNIEATLENVALGE